MARTRFMARFIPEDLLINILVRLPLKSLFRFKAVCKSWNLIISSSSFKEAWDAIARDAATGKLLCFYQPNDETPGVASLFDPGVPKITDLDWDPFLDKQFRNKQHFLNGLCVIGPVHGIYCLYNKRWVDLVTLWNPATGQFKHITPSVLPLPSSSPSIRCIGIRFGFDSTTNDFKLVLMYGWFDHLYPHNIFKIYDMSTNSWKNTNHLDLLRDPNCYVQSIGVSHGAGGDGCFVNGACHWPCDWTLKNNSGILRHGALAFNLTTESFQLIRGPDHMSHLHEISKWQDNKSLAMTIFHAFPRPRHEVWVMTEYGVEDSWVKVYSFELNVPITSLGIPNDLLLLYLEGRQHVGSSVLARAYKALGLAPPTSSDLKKVVGVVKYEETLVGASIFNRHCSTEKKKGKFARRKRLCTRAPFGTPSTKKKKS